MSQANWIEWFREQPAQEQRPGPFYTRLPSWLVNWEDWLTFVICMVTFLSVARLVEAADWVQGMPSLTLISFLRRRPRLASRVSASTRSSCICCVSSPARRSSVDSSCTTWARRRSGRDWRTSGIAGAIGLT